MKNLEEILKNKNVPLDKVKIMRDNVIEGRFSIQFDEDDNIEQILAIQKFLRKQCTFLIRNRIDDERKRFELVGWYMVP